MMGKERFHIQANYDPEQGAFRLEVSSGGAGLVVNGIDELQFGRIIEYLDLVWESYVEAKRSGDPRIKPR